MADFIVKTGISKTVGLPDYDHFSASCGFEITVDIGALADRDRLSRLIGDAYKHCLDSVDEQIHAATHKAPPAPPVQTAPAVQPLPPADSFGQWMKDKLSDVPMEMATLVGQTYKAIFPAGTETNWQNQGQLLADHWKATPNARAVFEQAFYDSIPTS